jgi:teichuronic acid biosynthesis glycosyltransferase TuaH
MMPDRGKADDRPKFTIAYFCLGDKWQDWERRGFANRTANIALELSCHPRVKRLVVVNNPTSYAAVFARMLKQKGKAIYPAVRQVREVDKKVTTIEQIRLLPKERANATAFSINKTLFRSKLIGLVENEIYPREDSKLVLWLNSPVFADMIGELGEDLVVYDARDDWIHHPQLKPINKSLGCGYRDIKKHADLVFAVSQSLVETFNDGKPDAKLIPNGIATGLFNASLRYEPLPELQLLARPVVGYVGKMQDRFDVDLMVEVARGFPGASFVFVGPVFTPHHFEPLRKLANVLFTGRVHQSRIPQFISAFDVCIMPHVKDRLTAAMNPLKIYEYLALGKPVVCTDVGELSQFAGLVETAGDAEAFIREIKHLANPVGQTRETQSSREARIKFASGQGWTERVRCMLKEIDRKLSEKAS